MRHDHDLGEVVAVVEEALGAFRAAEAVHGGEEREEEAMAILWVDVFLEKGGEGGDSGRSGRRRGRACRGGG